MKRWCTRIVLSALLGYAVYMIATYLSWGDFSLSELNFTSIQLLDTPTSSASFYTRAGFAGIVALAVCSWTGLWEWFFGDWF